MFKIKRLLLIIMLGISMSAFMVANIGAWTKLVNDRWKLNPGSICLDSIWKGLGDCDACADIGVTLEVDSAECDTCINGGDNDGGIGEPFGPIEPILISGYDMIDAENLTARGRTFSNICWEQAEIDYAISLGAPPGICPNDNWSLGGCFILSTDVTIEACGNDSNGDWRLIRVITGHCDWNDGTSEYDCTENSNDLQPVGTPCPF